MIAPSSARKIFASGRPFDPEDGTTVLEPGGLGKGYWTGCPSALYEPDRRRFLLTYRRRNPRGSQRQRGFECAVASSEDGVVFTDIWSVNKEELDSDSLERFSLHRAPDGDYLLYLSYLDPDDGRWRIDVIKATDPSGFDLRHATAVFRANDVGVDAVKDPYVVQHGEIYLMYISTFLTEAGPAPTSLATSADGVRFEWRGECFAVGDGWDRYQARLSGIVRAGGLYIAYYDGAGDPSEDTEERCGIAISDDLHRWERLTNDEPWLVSPHASGSLRYVDVVPVDGQLFVYYEYARADGSHELRVNRIAAT